MRKDYLKQTTIRKVNTALLSYIFQSTKDDTYGISRHMTGHTRHPKQLSRFSAVLRIKCGQDNPKN